MAAPKEAQRPQQPVPPLEPVFSTAPTDKTSSKTPNPSERQEHMLRSDYAPVRIAFAKDNAEKLELSKKFLSQLYGYQEQLSKLQIPPDAASAANFSSLRTAFSQTAQKAENLISLLESGKLKSQDQEAAFALLETLLNGAKISLFMQLDSLAPKNDEFKETSVLDIENPGKRKKAYEGTYSGFFDRITYQTWEYKGQSKSRGYVEQGFISEFFKWKADFIYSQTRAFYEQHKSLCSPSSFEAVQQKYNGAMQASLLEETRTYNWARTNYEALKSLSEECETFSLRLSIDVQREQNKTKTTPVFGGLLKIRESTRTDMLAWNSAVQTLCALGIGMTGGPAGKAFEKLYFSYHAGSQIAQGDALGGAIFLTALWSGPLAGTLQGLSEGTKAAAKFLSFAGTSAGMYMLGSMAYGTAVTLSDMEKFGFSHEGAAMLVESGVFAAVGIKSGREARKTPLRRALSAEKKVEQIGWGDAAKRTASLLDATEQYVLAGNKKEAQSTYNSAIQSLQEAAKKHLMFAYEEALSSCIKEGRLGDFQEICSRGYEALRAQYNLPENIFESTPELATLYHRAASLSAKSGEAGIVPSKLRELEQQFSESDAYKGIQHLYSLPESAISIMEEAADAYLLAGKPKEAIDLLLAVAHKAGSDNRPQLYEKAEKVQLENLEFGSLFDTYDSMSLGSPQRTDFFRSKAEQLVSLAKQLQSQEKYEKAADALEVAMECMLFGSVSKDSQFYQLAAGINLAAGRHGKALGFQLNAIEPATRKADTNNAIAMYEEAAARFEAAGTHSQAGRLFFEAANLLSISNPFVKSDPARTAGLYEKAGMCYLSSTEPANLSNHLIAAAINFSSAAKLLEVLDKPRAATLYERAGKLSLDAGRSIETADNFEHAAALYARIGDTQNEHAADLYSLSGDAYARCMNFENAGRNYARAAQFLGNGKRDAFRLSKVELLETAAGNLRDANKKDEASRVYYAAAQLVRAIDSERSGILFEMAGDYAPSAQTKINYYRLARETTYGRATNLTLAEKYVQANISDHELTVAVGVYHGCAELAGSASEAAAYRSKADILARIGSWIEDAKKSPNAGEFLGAYSFKWLQLGNFAQISEFIDAGLHPEVAFVLLDCKTDWSAEQMAGLRRLLPPGGEASKGKYARSNLISFMQTHPALQARILEYCLQKTPSKTQDMELLSLMSLANSLGEKFVEKLVSEPFSSIPSSLERGRTITIELLSSNYSREAFQNVPTEHLARWLSVFPEFEQTMRVHNDENLIPPLRLLSTIELLGEQERFSQHSPELAAYLKENAQTLFPQEAERTAILQYLQKWESMEPEKAILMTADADVARATLAKWNAPISIDHILEEVSAIDRSESVRTHLDAVFHKGHFSEYFLHAASLREGAERLGKTLADEYRTRKAAGASEEELSRIKQRQASPEVALQSMFLNYEAKFDALQAKIQESGAVLAPYADLLAEWGFDYGDSFGNKVFRGELALLSKRCNEELKKSPKDTRLQELAREIGTLEGSCKKLDDYLITVAEDISPTKEGRQGILSYLREKQQWAQATREDFISGKLSYRETLAKIEKEQQEFYKLLKADLDKEEMPAQKEELLKSALLQYTEQTTITDLETIVSMARGTSSDAGKSLRYVAQDNFSLMELATVGQCLDYRYSKNSIGNAPFTVSYLDSWRQMIVAYPAEDAKMEHPRVDGLIFLSNVSEGASPARTSIVMDRIYCPDGTSMSWAKIEGQIKFILARSEATGMPIVIPEHISTYFKQVEELAASYGYSTREASANVPVFVGPAGETYCELTGYVHYNSNTTLTVNALILEKPK